MELCVYYVQLYRVRWAHYAAYYFTTTTSPLDGPQTCGPAAQFSEIAAAPLLFRRIGGGVCVCVRVSLTYYALVILGEGA